MNTQRLQVLRAVMASCMALYGIALCAQPTTGGGMPPAPPPESLAACKTLKSGQDCNFSSPQGTLKGSCWAPEGKPLACRPLNAPEGGMPPPK
ncbi:hypothetical protein [Limnohabitans sp. JirII-29]|uniref:hypothetical protein n=1 Tax=Limnohabitans sp. JirII-29 TaxID=1835756 RepID=UPI0011B231E4|nr:hypothetical protein [Limnohabitans sp. JirII-29]